MENSNIIKLLHLRRLELNMSQSELATMLNKHRTFVSKVELNQRQLTFQELKRYCNALKLEIKDFI